MTGPLLIIAASSVAQPVIELRGRVEVRTEAGLITDSGTALDGILAEAVARRERSDTDDSAIVLRLDSFGANTRLIGCCCEMASTKVLREDHAAVPGIKQVDSMIERLQEPDLVCSEGGLALQSSLPTSVEALWRGQAQKASASEIEDCGGWLSGSFHPLHGGHEQLRRVAAEWIGKPFGYELSIRNADKPPIDHLTLTARLMQFRDEPVIVTLAPTFIEKARLLPGACFAVGIDTAERIVDPRFYHAGAQERDDALDEMSALGTRFLIGGRLCGDQFRFAENTTRELRSAMVSHSSLFEQIPEELFRADISSTRLREDGQSIWNLCFGSGW